jgi:hypothetical protein
MALAGVVNSSRQIMKKYEQLMWQVIGRQFAAMKC